MRKHIIRLYTYNVRRNSALRPISTRNWVKRSSFHWLNNNAWIRIYHHRFGVSLNPSRNRRWWNHFRLSMLLILCRTELNRPPVPSARIESICELVKVNVMTVPVKWHSFGVNHYTRTMGLCGHLTSNGHERVHRSSVAWQRNRHSRKWF